jgi:phosphatidyl-myo-inositol alpha-mannosyltransferase
MRVAILCPYSLSVPGGVQGQVLGLATELRRLGHVATVLAPMDQRDMAGPGESDSAEIVSLGRSVPIRANGSIAPVALGPVASFRALSALRNGAFDVLHIHEPFAPGASYACLALDGSPKVGTFHRSGPSAFYTVLRPVARALAGRLSTRCAVSVEAMRTAQDALGGEFCLVGNGVELERFSSALAWPTDGPTVMFVGRHESRKGLRILLEAFSLIETKDAVCWIAGRGPETEQLMHQYPPSRALRWLGRIDDSELARRLRGAQVACFPSLGGESFGVVLLEAMAARTAVVASDIPGYRSAADGHAGFFEPGNAPELADELAIALRDAGSRCGLSSRESIEAAFEHAARSSMSSIAGRYVSIYEHATAAGSHNEKPNHHRPKKSR